MGGALPLTKAYCVVVARADVDVMPPRGSDVRVTQPIRKHLDTKAVQAGAKIIGEGLENGKLSLVIDRYFPMAEHRDAIRYMESNRQVGKIVLNP